MILTTRQNGLYTDCVADCVGGGRYERKQTQFQYHQGEGRESGRRSAGRGAPRRWHDPGEAERCFEKAWAQHMDQARKQLMEGTASSQIICHFLKLGSSEARLDREETEERIKLTKAKTDSYESMKHIEELYANAIDAMRSYGGGGPLDKDI